MSDGPYTVCDVGQAGSSLDMVEAYEVLCVVEEVERK